MKLLIAGGRCLFVCVGLQSPGGAGGRFVIGQAL